MTQFYKEIFYCDRLTSVYSITGYISTESNGQIAFLTALPSPGKSPTATSPNHPTNLLGTFLTFSSLILQYSKGLCVYVHVCVFVYMHVCFYVGYMFVCSVFMCVCVCVCLCTCVVSCVCACAHVCVDIKVLGQYHYNIVTV